MDCKGEAEDANPDDASIASCTAADARSAARKVARRVLAAVLDTDPNSIRVLNRPVPRGCSEKSQKQEWALRTHTHCYPLSLVEIIKRASLPYVTRTRLSNRLPDPVVVKFYLYMATVSHAFITPITVVYMQSQGVGLAGVGTVQSLFWVGMTIAEVPTGYIGDRIGRRTSLFLATATIGAAIMGFWLADSFIEFAAVYLVWATGVTFRSGSLGAWLYDTLDERLDADEFARIRGRGGSVVLVVTAVGSLAGAFLYELDPLYPFLSTASLAALGLIVLWTFPTTSLDNQSTGTDNSGDPDDETSDTLEFVEALKTARQHLTSQHLRWFVVYTGALYVAHQVVSTFIQPAALAAGLEVTQLGVLYAVIVGLSAGASAAAGRVKDTFGIEGWFMMAPLVVGVPLAATALTPLMALPAIAGVRFVDKLSSPLRKQYINDRVPSVGRATILSAVSMVFGIVAAPARILGGIASEQFSVSLMLAGLGVIVLVVIAGVYAGATPFTGSQPQSVGGG